VLKNFISGERTVSVRDNPPLITHGVKSDVRGFWLSGQGCGGPLPSLGAFLQTSADKFFASAQKFFVKPHHVITEIVQPL
jgi:hypothetical protein